MEITKFRLQNLVFGVWGLRLRGPVRNIPCMSFAALSLLAGLDWDCYRLQCFGSRRKLRSKSLEPYLYSVVYFYLLKACRMEQCAMQSSFLFGLACFSGFVFQFCPFVTGFRWRLAQPRQKARRNRIVSEHASSSFFWGGGKGGGGCGGWGLGLL